MIPLRSCVTASRNQDSTDRVWAPSNATSRRNATESAFRQGQGLYHHILRQLTCLLQVAVDPFSAEHAKCSRCMLNACSR